MSTLKYQVVYVQNNQRITEFCKTLAYAKKRAKQTGGTFGKAE